MQTGFIAAISRGHNSGVCLLKDGKIVFAIEEERLSRRKYDGTPLNSLSLVRQYTNRIDKLIIIHTHPLEGAAVTDFTTEDIYTAAARKLGLIENNVFYENENNKHPQVLDYSRFHHKAHAACAFYRSGFDTAVSLVVDGAGTFYHLKAPSNPDNAGFFEVESIYKCEYPADIKLVYKHYAGVGPTETTFDKNMSSLYFDEEGTHEALISDHAGITKVYEAVTEYCGFNAIEAGKTMGLFPYGKPNKNIPNLFTQVGEFSLSDRNVVAPFYPYSGRVNMNIHPFLSNHVVLEGQDLTHLQNRRDLAYLVQKQSQEEVLKLIRKAVQVTGEKNVVLSGGYGLNCVANYYYLEQLKDEGINLYVDPISNDGGTAIGAAFLYYYQTFSSMDKQPQEIYLGPYHQYPEKYIEQLVELVSNNGEVVTANKNDVVRLLREKNIVTIFQGRSENGPRALGNRSVLFDPTFPDGKDYVNRIKRREYFRPFAGSILKEHVHEWFDLRGMDETPFMMYAVNCKEGVAEKIPSIIHEDGTCRIQTVTKEQNKHYYDLIEEFYKQTGIPIVFNTSFNLGGEPLVETLDDAVRTLVLSDIEYLYLPEYEKLVKIPNTSE